MDDTPALSGGEKDAAAADSDDENSAAGFECLKTVWEGGKMEKSFDADGKPKLRCLHGDCGATWSHHNHTKALGHVLGGNVDVKKCRFVSAAWRRLYLTINATKRRAKEQRIQDHARMSMNLDAIEETATAALGRTGTPSEFSTESSWAPPAQSQSQVSCLSSESDSLLMPPPSLAPSATSAAVVSNQNIAPLFKGGAFGRAVKRQKSDKHLTQMNIVTSMGKNHPKAEEELSLSIAHLIHAVGLPFNLAENELFKRMLTKARNVNNQYSPPGRNEVGGKWLNSVHAAYQVNAIESCRASGAKMGISVGGDAATINREPLINCIAASPSNHSLVLDVIDSSEHMADNGKKDAMYLCKVMLPCLEIIDPDKNLVDLVTFDGASNVQKAAQLMKIHYPMITVSPAIEHTVSLVFGRVMHLRPIKDLCELASKVRLCFLRSFS